MERGQVLIVVAVAIVGIVAIVGLSLDVGVMFIENARLRRAVDSAALAAALQYREGYEPSELRASAIEFLRLNSINDPNAIVKVCIKPGLAPTDPNYIYHDEALCSTPPRKLVHVIAYGRAYLAFLPVIGLNSVPVAAEAISETASVDVVLVIDRSESMTYTAPPGTEERDPSICNVAANPIDPSYQGYCLPFDDVKRAAVGFVNTLYFPYDRVAVVTFDKNPTKVMDFSNIKSDIITAIKGLTVYQGDETASGPLTGLPGINAIYPNGNPSRYYDTTDPLNPIYRGLGCPQRDDPTLPNYPDPSPCTTTNIGAGMYYAGVEFNVPPVRTNSLWVVILLTDGVANAGYDVNGEYFCPESTWGNADTYDYSVSPPQLLSVLPKCNSGRTKSNPANRHSPSTSADYDAEDYAYAAADFVADDQHALTFTIGLGANVRTPSTVDGTYLGELYLKFAARCNDIDIPCTGLYSFAPDSSQLREIFQKIADNIATRLEH
jgi:hypothetical protein